MDKENLPIDEIEKFILWKDENRWFNFSDGKWNYTFEHGTAISKQNYEKNYRKTTSQLLTLYKEQSSINESY
jgi:hypothetical protein